jgi:hypothetical protein
MGFQLNEPHIGRIITYWKGIALPPTIYAHIRKFRPSAYLRPRN